MADVINPMQQDKIVIRCEGQNVIVLKNGLLVADLTWHAAKQLGQALTDKAKEAESNHWSACEKRLGREIDTRYILGIPLLDNEQQIERAG